MTSMTRLKNWKATRAGAFITIRGTDEGGVSLRIPGIRTIEAGLPFPVAIDRDGKRYELGSGTAA